MLQSSTVVAARVVLVARSMVVPVDRSMEDRSQDSSGWALR